jgi:hypothetical protein
MQRAQFERALAFAGVFRTSLAQDSASKKASLTPAQCPDSDANQTQAKMRQWIKLTLSFARIMSGSFGVNLLLALEPLNLNRYLSLKI